MREEEGEGWVTGLHKKMERREWGMKLETVLLRRGEQKERESRKRGRGKYSLTPTLAAGF